MEQSRDAEQARLVMRKKKRNKEQREKEQKERKSEKSVFRTEMGSR